jgi:ClpX C4-type zinc finger protein
MTLEGSLLAKAKAEAARLTEAEREVLLTRADYHTAVRRLHLAGASLREVAEALGLSHQRVQQMVGLAGGTWWQRAWGARSRRRDAVCTFCERPPSEVDKLIAGPNVFICDACVTLAESALATKRPAGRLAPAQGRLARCSFCRKRHTGGRVVIAARGANVCADCVTVCRQILDDRAAV